MTRLATQALYFGRAIPEDRVLAGVANVNVDSLGHTAGSIFGQGLRNVSGAVVGPQDATSCKSDLEKLLRAFQKERSLPLEASEISAPSAPVAANRPTGARLRNFDATPPEMYTMRGEAGSMGGEGGRTPQVAETCAA